MDRLGRKAVAVPCLVIMGVGLICLPVAQSFWALAAISIVLGVGNGLASGINMTLAADVAPLEARGQFFGVWRLVSDVGGFVGPLEVAAATALATLAGAAVLTGGLGLLGAAYVAVMVPETLQRLPPPPVQSDSSLA